MSALDQLEGEVKASAVARVAVAERWTNCVSLVAIFAFVLGLVAILHG